MTVRFTPGIMRHSGFPTNVLIKSVFKVARGCSGKGTSAYSFWNREGRVRSITEYGNLSHRANRGNMHYLFTFTLILSESTVLAMDHYKEALRHLPGQKSISPLGKRLSLSLSLSLSDLSHSMPHDCAVDFWESRLLDPAEREY